MSALGTAFHKSAGQHGTDGDDLRHMLKDLGFTQAEFASRVGVTVRAVNMWATNARPVPGPVMAYLNLLAEVRRVSR